MVVTACQNTSFSPPPPASQRVSEPANQQASESASQRVSELANQRVSESTPFTMATPTLEPTPTPTVGPTPTASFTPSPSPTATPTATEKAASGPTPTPNLARAEAVAVPPLGTFQYETTITLATYPFRDYLNEQIDPVYNIPVLYFDRAAFEAAAPTPIPVDYTGVVLENPYLRLTFLPELGGRLYSAIIKTTGQEIFYHNKVIKPSRYGILQPLEANWWLAAGGLEWAYPTQEHGYRWGVPWTYRAAQFADRVSITLTDLASDPLPPSGTFPPARTSQRGRSSRVGVSVEVTLPADSAFFTVTPRLVNASSMTVPVQFWTDAVLSLAPETMSPQTQFIIPVDQMTIHSRGDEGWDMPEAQAQAPWPVIGAANLQVYDQWANYLGFFIPYMATPFMGAYNPTADLGVVRLIEPGTVPGNKLFAFGASFPDRSYTDDGSQYFEIWGGANAGFWPEDDILVPPGGELGWQERWWPLAGLGGLTWANDNAAIHLTQAGDTYTLSALVSQPTQGRLIILSGGTTVLSEPFSAEPAEVVRWQFSAPAGGVHVRLVDGRGRILLEYQDREY